MKIQPLVTAGLALLLATMAAGVSGQYRFNVKRTIGETGHQIAFASFSPDGSYIATTGSDSSIIVWNADRLTIHRTLTGLEARANAAVFTTDNRYLLSGGKDNKVSMWDLGSLPPRIIRTFGGEGGQIKTLDVSPDGSFLATGSEDASVRIWDLQSSNLVYELKGHSKEVNTVRFSPDGRSLASGGADGKLVLWNVGNGSILSSVEGHRGWIRDVVFSRDGKLLGSCGDDKLVKTWLVPGLAAEGTFKGHGDWVQAIDFTPDSKTLLSAGRDRLILMWDVATRKVLFQSEKKEQIVTHVDIHPARPDFISSCYGSESLETWVFSGVDESQWDTPAATLAATPPATVAPTRPLQEEQGAPAIELLSPLPVQGRIVHDSKSILLVGRVSDPDGISAFLINRTLVTLAGGGIFQYTLDLNKGENPLEMVAVNNKGKMGKVELAVDCSAGDAPAAGPAVAKTEKRGYYALLIGVNEYQHPDINDLDNPIRDAESLYNVLTTRYTFEKENMTFLKNPTQAEIITTLDELSRELTSTDNLLIFYAGHGYWDEKGRVGYWFPSDASRTTTVNWFRNSTLRDFIGSIETRHTLLVADACFSGAIFKSRAAFADAPQGIEKLYELPSRKAMTSGILQEVPDESVFLKYLVKRLEENQEKFLTSEFLFSSFKTAVMDNSSNVPQYGVIQNVGDEGGDFVFVKRGP
jgi:WD40 repeat protein